MLQGSSASPGRFVKFINEVIKGLEHVVAYLEDMIVFDSDLTAHIKTIRAIYEHLHKNKLKRSSSKAQLAATVAYFLGHSISPLGVRLNEENMSAIIKITIPRDLKQVRAMIGGLGYYRKFLCYLSKRIRLITSLSRKGVKFEFTLAMKVFVRGILAELATPPILVSRQRRHRRRLPPLPRVLRRVHQRFWRCA